MMKARTYRSFLVTFLVLTNLVSSAMIFGSKTEAAFSPVRYSRFFVYFPLVLKSGAYTIPVEYFVPYTTSLARVSMEALLAGVPSNTGLLVIPLPKETKIRNISIKDGICTVDFSQDIQKVSVGAMGEAAILNSITKTLCQFRTIKAVRILVEGKECESLAGHVDITKPLKPLEGSNGFFVTFQDAIIHWGGGAISILQEMDIIDGYPDGTFKPDRQLTRAEFLKMLVETLRLPFSVTGQGSRPSSDVVFKDVADHWCRSYVESALQAAIINPKDYGENLNPDQVIWREEVAWLLSKGSSVFMAQHPNIQFKRSEDAISFTDSAAIQEEYREAVTECARYGFIKGYPDGSFQPKKGLTRAEACAVLTRMLGVRGERILLLSPTPGFKWDDSKVFAMGSASAFEGTVNFRIKTKGSVAGSSLESTTVFEGYTTSTYGMGWGVFGISVDKALLSTKDNLLLQVYLISMKDGTEESVVEVGE